jgi:hypothetical protein
MAMPYPFTKGTQMNRIGTLVLRSVLITGLAAGAGLATSGCVVVPARPYGVVRVAPPVVVVPGPGYYYGDGYYHHRRYDRD